MSSRIVLRLDRGLGWTKPLAVACCAVCGAELARHRSPARLPGTTSLATDLALVQGQPQPVRRRRWPPARHSAAVPRAGRR